jgi:hypothetical protein
LEMWTAGIAFMSFPSFAAMSSLEHCAHENITQLPCKHNADVWTDLQIITYSACASNQLQPQPTLISYSLHLVKHLLHNVIIQCHNTLVSTSTLYSKGQFKCHRRDQLSTINYTIASSFKILSNHNNLGLTHHLMQYQFCSCKVSLTDSHYSAWVSKY